MSIGFSLCPECLAKYRGLRFDPHARYTLNIMPLCSLMWGDEHPDNNLPQRLGHEGCLNSIIRVAVARTGLWRSGEISEGSKKLWDDARRLLPEWPLWQRLSLDPKQLKSLDGCAEELEGFMGVIRKDFPVITTTNEGGLSRFTARRAADRHTSAVRHKTLTRRWWQFWK